MKSVIVRTTIANSVLFALSIATSPCAYGRDRDGNGWTNYFARAVQDGGGLPRATNAVQRFGITTNVVQILSAKGYRQRASSEYAMRSGVPLTVSVMEIDSVEGVKTQRVRVCTIECKNGQDEVMNGLCALMDAHTSMGGIVYKRLKDGPGDLCFAFRHQAEQQTGGLTVLFFCRDNVAVQVSLRSPEGDVAAVARAIDSAISSVPGDQNSAPKARNP